MNRLAGGPATFSRSLDRYVEGMPLIHQGYGQVVYDRSAVAYLDLVMALGSLPLGYSCPGVSVAVINSVLKGNCFTTSTAMEYMVAEKLCDLLHYDSVRFTKTGSDSLVAAVRLARAYQPPYRQKILVEKTAYHGQHIQWKPPAKGILPSELEMYAQFSWHDDGFYRINWDELAAVIVEYPLFDVDNKLLELRKIARQTGTIFILDEVVTGLRWKDGSVNEHLKVDADLICMGKALGNGYNIGSVIGKKEFMRLFDWPDPVFISTTSGTEEISFAAAMYVLSQCPIWPDLEHIGNEILKLPNNLWVEVVGHPCRSLFTVKDGNDSILLYLWQKALLKCRVIANRPNYPSLGMTTQNIAWLHEAYEIALEDMQTWTTEYPPEKYLELVGKLPVPLFTTR